MDLQPLSGEVALALIAIMIGLWQVELAKVGLQKKREKSNLPPAGSSKKTFSRRTSREDGRAPQQRQALDFGKPSRQCAPSAA
ncbi:MAG TPA: hypothetical protein VF618_23015 [Thermoanaerobaculia bacterium]